MEDGRKHIVLTVSILWQIWKVRNDWCFNRKRKEERLVINKALDEWHEFEECNEFRTEERSRTQTEERINNCWRPPDPRTICINTDAAVHKATKASGRGMVARNYLGNILAAEAHVDRYSGLVQIEEAKAIREALILARTI
ncbi:hypothetical protein ACH5RR_009461 [Cinchona calisaya]|uniref:RNase H type-1 domain-containing protein n=1 Tax=Cinchona calisaya TaxID=153742 RepID=A0ABD3AES1_9GENT